MQKNIIKYLAIIIIEIIFFYTASSQTTVDEILKNVNNISDTVVKIEKLLKYSEDNIHKNDSVSIGILNYTLKLSNKIEYLDGQIKCNEQFIKIFTTRNEIKKIKNFIDKSIYLRQVYYEKNHDDTININKLISLYEKNAEIFLINSEVLSAIEFYKKILNLSEIQGNIYISAKTSKSIADCYRLKNDNTNAATYYLQSVKFYEELKSEENLQEIFYLLGITFYEMGNIKLSLNNFYSSLEISEKLKNNDYTLLCYSNISSIYVNLKLFDKALDYNNKSLKLLKNVTDTFSLTTSYIRQAEILFEMEDYENSEVYFIKCIEFLKNNSQPSVIANAYNGLGKLYDKLENHSEAYKYFLISMSIRNKFGNTDDIANSYINIGKHFLLIDSLSDAEVFLVKGFKMTQEKNYNIETMESAKSLSELYRKKEEFDKALNYQLIYENINDSVISQDVANALAKIELEYEFEQEKKEKDEELHAVKRYRNLLFIIITLLIIFVAFVLYSYRIIVKQNKVLEDSRKEIENQNKLIQEKSEEFEKLAIVASKSDNGVVIIDKNGYIEWINEGGRRIYSNDEILKRVQVGADIRKVSSKENISELIDKCITTLKSVHSEYFNNDTENPIWLQTTITPIFDNKNELKLIAVDADVTEIKLAERQIINQKTELQDQADLLSLYVSQLNAQKIAMMENNEELKQQREELITQTELLELTNKKLEKLSIIASKTDNSVFIAEADGIISWVNEAFTRHTGYHLEEFTARFGNNILEASSFIDIEDVFEECIKTKKTVVYSSKMQTKSRIEKWFQTTLTPIVNDSNKIIQIIGIDTDITIIKHAEEKIAIKNQEIKDSITYASRIQTALLPMDIYISSVFENYFIINKPRDIVSGDFYWFGYRENKAILVVADCTGHGIPGAFLSMLGIMSLNNLVYKVKRLHSDDILNALNKNIINLLHQRGKEGEARDGMDVALCIIDLENLTLEYSGANSPVYIVKNQIDTDDLPVIEKLNPNKMPIGYFIGLEESFNRHTIKIDKKDTLYMFTDGFIDQFGGEENKKYLAKNFKELLRKINHIPIKERKLFLENELNNWKGNNEQVDDIMIAGIEFD